VTDVPGAAAPAVLELADVTVRRGGRVILGPLDWTIRAGERWVVLGANGAGKTTLLEVASARLWPTTGSVAVLGGALGSVDARELRTRIGYAGSGVDRELVESMTALDAVTTAIHGDLAPWWHAAEAGDVERALGLLGRMGVAALAGSQLTTLSAGERRRVLLARALMPAPALVLLDEPTVSLDLAAREDVFEAIEGLAEDPALPAMLLVSHHVEEIPPGFGHALLLRDGIVVSSGPAATALTSATLSATYGRELRLDTIDGRYLARRASA
jgi:iron complex transport system ATP-binding protein